MSGRRWAWDRAFGRTGERVPAVGLGTWEMERDPAASVKALQLGIDLGRELRDESAADPPRADEPDESGADPPRDESGRGYAAHIDTAEMYGSGRVEEIVGRAIEGRPREEIFLVTKVLPGNASRSGTVEACERSLRRLGTDYADLFLLHWESHHPLKGTVEAFRELQEAGKIRHWGVSNFDEKALARALRLAAAGTRPACDQVLYHLEERAVEHEVLPACAAAGVALVAYSPLGSGGFPEPDSPGGKVLAEVAAAHEVRGEPATPHQVALAWLLRRPEVFVIPKAATPAHVEANLGAAFLELTDSELGRIEQAFPRAEWTGGVPVL